MAGDRRIGALAALAGLRSRHGGRLRVAARPPRAGGGVRGRRRAGAGRTRPSRRCSPPSSRAAWAAIGAATTGRSGPHAVTALRHRRRHPGRRRLPRRAASTIRSRRRCCSWRGDWSSLDARRVGIVGTRNATGPGCEFAATARPRVSRPTVSRSCPDSPRASTAQPTAASCGSTASRRRRSSPTVPTRPTRVSTASCGTPSRRRAADLGVAAGHRAGEVPVPAAQPHHRRAQRGARRGREPRARRFADDGEGGARAVHRRHGRARVGQQPRRRRNQPTDPRRGDTGHRRRRRARWRSGSTTVTPTGGLRSPTAAAWRRGRRARALSCRPVHARRRSSPISDFRSPRRR